LVLVLVLVLVLGALCGGAPELAIATMGHSLARSAILSNLATVMQAGQILGTVDVDLLR